MSRNITTELSTELGADVVYPVLLLDLEFISGWLYLYTGIGDLVFNGHTYTGVGSILSLSPIEETGEVRAVGITVTLAGLDTSITSVALQQVAQNRQGIIRLGLRAGLDGAWINGGPAIAFSGRLDLSTIKEDDRGTTVAINYESRLVNLEVPRLWSWTDQDQQTTYPGDLGLQQSGTIADQILNWGG
jgi:hypothetical protein